MLQGISKIELENSIELYWGLGQGVTEVAGAGQVIKAERTHIRFDELQPDTEYEFIVKTIDSIETVKARTLPQWARIDVTKAPYNCVGDGKTLNTTGLQAAIDDCKIGQCVYVPEGTFLTGALNLHSDMVLYVAEGATLQGTSELQDYLPKIHSRFEGTEMECYRSLLNMGTLDRNDDYNCQNVIITGSGSILGGGFDLMMNTINFERERLKEEIAALGDEIKTYENENTIPGRFRGRLINMSNCNHILISGLTLGDGASWNVHFIYSNDIVTNRCKFVSEGVWNGDGWDPDSSSNCTIFGCEFHTEDDSVAIKSGKNPEGNEVNRPTRNINIFDNYSHYGHGLCIGSEMSGGVEDVNIWDCHMGDSLSGIEIKATKKRGGFVRDIHVENVVTSHVMFHAVGYNDDGIGAEHPPVLEDCTFKNMQIYGELYDAKHEYHECDAIELIGFDEPGYEVRNVEFEDLVLGKPGKEGRTQRLSLGLVEGISFRNVRCV